LVSIKFSVEQASILDHAGSSLTVGVPGSGKTTLLIEKAARLAQAADRPGEVALVGFSWRSVLLMKGIFEKRYKNLAEKVHFGTIKDLAQVELEKTADQPIVFADNARVRELVRYAMQGQKFPGTLDEAEHIVRTFRSQLKSPRENERHYPLYERYQHLLEQSGAIDRHGIIRQHIISMENETAAACGAKYLLIDNIQDATPLQYRWIMSHLHGGTTLILMGNDDLTAFALDGAMGQEVFHKLEKNKHIQRFDLAVNYRTPASLLPAIGKIPRLLKNRISKQEKAARKKEAEFEVESCEDASTQLKTVLRRLQSLREQNPKARVGIVARHDEQASRIVHLLRMRGINPASYARLVWENKGAQHVLNLLYLILNQASKEQLFDVLGTFGVSLDVQAQMVQKGLQAKGWLVNGAPLPEGLTGELHLLATVRRQLLGNWQLIQARKLSPRDAFKALVHDLILNLDQQDRRSALLALDMLLHIEGSLKDVLPRIQQETAPDMKSPIVVAPVREVRNMEFDHLILPFAREGQWPSMAEEFLGMDAEHERRLFYLALSRTKGSVTITYTHKISPFVQEMLSSLKGWGKST
jgi:superfamily I DNA/RNA helicase